MAQTYQSTVINVSADKVWAGIRNFHDLSWAPNVVTRVEIVGSKKGDTVTDRDHTFVEWSSAWERNDATVSEFMHGIYVVMLEDMKKSLEH